MEKVLITGMGIISPIGVTLDQNWQSIINGVSGVKQIDTFDATSYRTRFAGLIDDILVDESHQGKIKKRLRKKMSRSVYLNCLVSNMAIEDSGIDFSKINLERCGVAIGATGTELNPNEFVPLTDHDDSRIIKLMSNAYPAWISLNYGLEGPSMTVGTACASANYAIAWAYQQIALGLCDVMIAGGASNPVNPELLTGFSQMMALSERNDSPEEASRPFDKARDGFVMGEGSGLLILESETSARKRGARVYAELKLPSLTSEAYNIVAPAKDGAGMSKCMSKALFNANLNPQDIQYINAHGTSTKLNDDYETKAI
ncbi:MAG: beta-ketoacyl-[acyl-carrier-protein] synthase family protein, partial [Gammaproteobacteria bacterium]|nr:beta-ketoacyl-[acyl-carrier-protein] synthase family protein [Gammaproteobacteria bacterium]